MSFYHPNGELRSRWKLQSIPAAAGAVTAELKTGS
jgi:hypothetical protein